jgi:hypothetical protein
MISPAIDPATSSNRMPMRDGQRRQSWRFLSSPPAMALRSVSQGNGGRSVDQSAYQPRRITCRPVLPIGNLIQSSLGAPTAFSMMVPWLAEAEEWKRLKNSDQPWIKQIPLGLDWCSA